MQPSAKCELVTVPELPLDFTRNQRREEAFYSTLKQHPIHWEIHVFINWNNQRHLLSPSHFSKWCKEAQVFSKCMQSHGAHSKRVEVSSHDSWWSHGMIAFLVSAYPVDTIGKSLSVYLNKELGRPKKIQHDAGTIISPILFKGGAQDLS